MNVEMNELPYLPHEEMNEEMNVENNELPYLPHEEMNEEKNVENNELPYLPPELWLLVFRYLNTTEKHTVRLCCKKSRDLIDHPFLWRDYTVVLSNHLQYPSGFWDMLRYRRITRAAVEHLWPNDWEFLVKTLPSLTTVVCLKERRRCKTAYLGDLSAFPDLRVLSVRNAIWGDPLLAQCKTEHLVAQLTHLSVCNVRLSNTIEFMEVLSQMVNLEYLMFHQQVQQERKGFRPVPCEIFHKLLLNLKKLKHLSWGMKGEPLMPLPEDYFFPAQPESPEVYSGPALTSLELMNYTEMILAKNALRGLTSLKSLTVHYRYIWDGTHCNLTSWLSDLQELESLTIIGGNFFASQTIRFPPRLTKLTLRTALCMCQLNFIASKLKRVEYLDVDQSRFTGTLCQELPLLFPQIKTLRIRFCREEPKRELLFLNGLRHLQRLELVLACPNIPRSNSVHSPWLTPNLKGLIRKLLRLSRNRFRIVTKLREKDIVKGCNCVCEGF